MTIEVDKDKLIAAVTEQFENAGIKVMPQIEEDIEDAIDQLEEDPEGYLAELLFEDVQSSIEPDDLDESSEE